MSEKLTGLVAGMPIVYGGDRVVRIDADLAEAFVDGDRLVVVQDSGDLLHIPAAEWSVAASAVDEAVAAFSAMGTLDDTCLTKFYEEFAARLADDDVFDIVASANAIDVARARETGRSTTRLVLDESMRSGMIDGLRLWASSTASQPRVVETVDHDGWSLDQVRSGLGVVGFVFEGRPNVFADATGVLVGGNTVVFRIGSAALGTARAVMSHIITPALEESGLPKGAVALVDSPSRAAGWAMFSDPRLGLAVARGSGAAVSQLGSVARQAGIPVSLHGTGGAWIVASETADAAAFGLAVFNSLDRKVCNTVNTVCVVQSRAADLIPVFLEALDKAGTRRHTISKLHATNSAASFIPPAWWEPAAISRAGGVVTEPRAETLGDHELGLEWEWEDSPEVTLAVVDTVADAIAEFNSQSPHFIVSLIAESATEHQRFFETVDAPFVGNGFTRWVDGQYALERPELGLSNWQYGRLFGRAGILTGDSIYTIRSRMTQSDPELGR